MPAVYIGRCMPKSACFWSGYPGRGTICCCWHSHHSSFSENFLFLILSFLVLSGREPNSVVLLPNNLIINVTHISMFRNYSFNFGRNVTKRGSNMERRRERNTAEPKFELKSFRPSSCIFYGRGRI